MSKIDSPEIYVASSQRDPRGGAPRGAGVALAVVAGTLCWAAIFILFL